jgi:type II secretory pathway pseudopilin PulG
MMMAMWVHRSERGVTLMETLIALFILAAVGVAVIAGVYTSVKGTDLTRTRITAESLARIELEYVSSQPFKTNWDYSLPNDSPTYPTGWRAPLTFPIDYSNGYSITVAASENVTTGTKASSKQKIKVDVKYSNSTNPNIPILTIVTYQTQ